MGRMRAAFRTLGCKVNQVETEALLGFLKALEPEVVPVEAGGADLVVINTCAVTTTAEADARKEIRRARRHNPEAFIVVTGCYAELAPEEVEALGADAVVPNARKAELPKVILERFGLPSDPITTPPNEFWGAGERGLLNSRVRAFSRCRTGARRGAPTASSLGLGARKGTGTTGKPWPKPRPSSVWASRRSSSPGCASELPGPPQGPGGPGGGPLPPGGQGAPFLH
jgi:hypothetical protein